MALGKKPTVLTAKGKACKAKFTTDDAMFKAYKVFVPNGRAKKGATRKHANGVGAALGGCPKSATMMLAILRKRAKGKPRPAVRRPTAAQLRAVRLRKTGKRPVRTVAVSKRVVRRKKTAPKTMKRIGMRRARAKAAAVRKVRPRFSMVRDLGRKGKYSKVLYRGDRYVVRKGGKIRGYL